MPTLDPEYQQYLLDCARLHCEPVPLEDFDRNAWLRGELQTYDHVYQQQPAAYARVRL